MPSEITIIGAGIGGLTTGIALASRNIPFRIFEAAPILSEAGAGIWVPPNALEVLSRLNVAQEVAANGTPIEKAELSDYKAGLLQVAETRTARHATIAIHRAWLQQILAAHIPPESLVLGRRCISVQILERSIRVSFADGSTHDAESVIGADGLSSAVRQSLFPQVQPLYSGQTSWRAIVAYELPLHFEGISAEIWAPGCRFGFSSIGGGRTYWYATADAPPATHVANARDHLLSLYNAFPPPVHSLVEETSPDALIQTDLSDLPPDAPWRSGRIVLLGDAAHGTTPNLGQGGAQAVEDAWVIAEQIAAHDRSEDAFAAYEQVRRRKASMIIKRARQLGRVGHLRNPLGRALRNLAVRLTPANITRRELSRIYQPPSA